MYKHNPSQIVAKIQLLFYNEGQLERNEVKHVSQKYKDLEYKSG